MLLLFAKVRVHHQLLIFIPLHMKVGAQQSSQGAQETIQVSEQLLRLQSDHDDQDARYNYSWNVNRTVQAVPATILYVAARVTDAVTVVGCTVSLIPNKYTEQRDGCLVDSA